MSYHEKDSSAGFDLLSKLGALEPEVGKLLYRSQSLEAQTGTTVGLGRGLRRR